MSISAPQDHFSGHAKEYAQFRPDYPSELFRIILEHCPDSPMAADIATGSGQCAVAIAPRCKRVFGLDISSEQLKHASGHPKLSYLVSRAETLPFKDNQLDLITVAQALHWLDLPHFFEEAERTLSPLGTLAIIGYGNCLVSPEVDRVVEHLYEAVLGKYWTPGRRWVEQGYENVAEQMPFGIPKVHKLEIDKCWTLAQFIGYLQTWSALKAYLNDHDASSLNATWTALTQAWGQGTKAVRWPLTLHLCRRK